MNIETFNVRVSCPTCAGTGSHETVHHARVGLHVRRCRRAKGLKLRQVANASGVSIGHLSDLERGARNWTQAKLDLILGAINDESFEV